jgi:hypothetical protein
MKLKPRTCLYLIVAIFLIGAHLEWRDHRVSQQAAKVHASN